MTEELNKAIQQAAGAAVELLKKSEQMALFGGEPHHVAYTRTNQSGTVSNVSAKGTLAQLKQPGDRYTTFDMKLAHHGKTNGAPQHEIDRAMAGQHYSEVANSPDSHMRAAHYHTDSATKATDEVYKLHHAESAAWHKKQATPPRKPRTTIDRPQVAQPAKFSATTTPAISHSAYDIESTHNSDGEPDRGNVTRAHGQKVANHFATQGWGKADHAAAEAHHWSQSSVYEHKADNAELAGNYVTAERHRYKMEAHSAIAKMHELARGMTN